MITRKESEEEEAEDEGEGGRTRRNGRKQLSTLERWQFEG